MEDEKIGGPRGLFATRGRKIAAAIAAAFIASVGGGLGAWAFQAAKDTTTDILDTGAPISVRVAAPGTVAVAWPGGQTYVFSASAGSGPEAVLSPDEARAAQRGSWGWAADHGGVVGSPQIIRLQVRGKGDEEVSTTRIAARIVRRSAPVEGWFVVAGGGRDAEEIRLAKIDLDSPDPSVLYYTSIYEGESKTLSLTVTRVDAEQIEIVARTTRDMVDWEAEVFYSGLDDGSVVADDDGKPFRVTAESASVGYRAIGGEDGNGCLRTPDRDGIGVQTPC